MATAQEAIDALAASQGVANSITPTVLAGILQDIYDEIRTNTGHASYTDTQYPNSAGAFTVPADTPTRVPNNAGIVYDDQKPAYVTGGLYDSIVELPAGYDAGVITGRDGDNLVAMIYLKATPSTANQSVDMWIDIGGDVNELYEVTNAFPKGAGVERGLIYALPAAYTRNTWESNGGKVFIQSNASLQIHSINFNLQISHRGV